MSTVKDAAYYREYRAKRGARTGAHGPAPSAPCGTVSAFKRHQRNGETIDAACREAWNASQRDYNRRRRATTPAAAAAAKTANS
jgi:hypothetical protein